LQVEFFYVKQLKNKLKKLATHAISVGHLASLDNGKDVMWKVAGWQHELCRLKWSVVNGISSPDVLNLTNKQSLSLPN